MSDDLLSAMTVVALMVFMILGGPLYLINQINPSPQIQPQTDIILGNVTNLTIEKWWLQDHHIVCVDKRYTFEISLDTYMKLSIGTPVRLDREFVQGEWRVVKVTVIE